MNFAELKSAVDLYLSKFTRGHIDERDLHGIQKQLPHLFYIYERIKFSAKERMSSEPNNPEVIAHLNEVRGVKKNLNKIGQFIDRAEKALDLFTVYKTTKKSTAAVSMKEPSTPDFTNLPSELLTEIFNYYSFYDKQQYRRISRKIHDAIENSYIKESTLVYPIDGKNTVFFIDLIKRPGINLTVHNLFDYIQLNRSAFEDSLNQLAQQEIKKNIEFYYQKVISIGVIALMAPQLFASELEEIGIDIKNYPNLIILIATIALCLAIGLQEKNLVVKEKTRLGLFFDQNFQSERHFKYELAVEPKIEELSVPEQITQR